MSKGIRSSRADSNAASSAAGAASDAHHDRFGHDDGVVHQESQGDDQRRQGHLIEADLELIHDQQAQNHGHRYKGGNDETGAHAETQQHHHHDDGHRLQQVADEIVHLLGDDVGLEGDEIELQSDRIPFL